VRTSFIYFLAVKYEEVKIIRSNLHFLLWFWSGFSFVNQCSLWYYYLVIVCDMLWTIWSCLIVNNSFLYCIKKNVLITILPTRSELFKRKIRIEIKPINNDTWLVSFMLSFSGFSPVLIGPKVIFFKLTWHRRPQQCAHLLDSTQPKRTEPNQISSKKATIGPKKIFLGNMNDASLKEQFWAQPNYKQTKFILWRIRFVTISMPHRMPHQIMSSVAKLQEGSYDALYWRFCTHH
jgi:hypothetical protein